MGLTYVVKVGGSILGGGVGMGIVSDIGKLASSHGVVLVHGGGDEVTQFAERLGKQQQFIVSPEGIRSRYTDRETMEIYTMVMAGKLNKGIVVELFKKGIKALGLCGVDGALLFGERKRKLIAVDERGRKRMVDGGYTGRVTKVKVDLLETLVNKGYVPVVSPIAVDGEGELLNVDGDRAASAIAGVLRADGVVFVTDVPGVIVRSRVIRTLTVGKAKELMPEIGFGMKTKLLASIEAIEMGAKKALIVDGSLEAPVVSALSGRSGTAITP